MMMMSEQNVQRDELIIVTGPHHEAKHAIGDDGSTARRGIHARTQRGRINIWVDTLCARTLSPFTIHGECPSVEGPLV